MMSNRKQRLRTLENTIRKNATAVVTTGQALQEIQNDELYLEHTKKNGEPIYPTWTKYLQHRVGNELGVEKTQAAQLIVDARIRPHLESSPAAAGEINWSTKAVYEFRRLAPVDDDHEQRFDFSKLRKTDVHKTAKIAVERAQAIADAQTEALGVERKPVVTSGIVRKVVDEYIGYEPETIEVDEGMDLDDWVKEQAREIKKLVEFIEDIPGDGWALFREDQPRLVKRLATAANSLAAICGG